MNFAAEFFRDNTVGVYFVYGLAFFVLGLAIALENRRTGSLQLWSSLWFLAAYGFLHGLEEWAEMFALIKYPTAASDFTLELRLIAAVLLPLSTAFLVHFGATLIASTNKNLRWLIWTAPALFAFWFVVVYVEHAFGGLDYGQKVAVASALARYILYLPGSVLSVIGMIGCSRIFQEQRIPSVARSCRWTAIAFGVNAFSAGIIVPAAPFFPASLLNSENFFALTNVPTELLRAVLAVVIAVLFVRVLRVFEVQQSRQLEKAYQDRYRAQKAALEMQRLAHEAAEQWSKELEKKVQERTEELEQRNCQLTAINAITVGLASSLDLPQMLEDTLDRISEMMSIPIGAIYLLNHESNKLILEACKGIAPEALSPYLPQEFLASVDFQARLNGAETDHRCGGQASIIAGLEGGPYSCLFSPIRSKDTTTAVALLVRRGSTGFTQHEVNTIITVCSQIAVALDNVRLFTEIQRRQLATDALYKIGMEISSMLELNQILDSVVEKARSLLGTDVASLSLAQPGKQNIFLKATNGAEPGITSCVGSRIDQVIAGKIFASGEALIVDDCYQDTIVPFTSEDSGAVDGLRSYLASPLKIGDSIVGTLYVGNRGKQSFSQDDLSLLSGLATQAAIAIENAQLYDRVQNMAVLEERDRLAREMHDGLAQILGYLNLETYSFEELLRDGKIEKIHEGIQQVRKTVQDAYADVRESILNLRTSVSADRGLIPTLEQYVREYSHQSKVYTELIVGDNVPARFPQTVEVQLVRIVQEALTNVRKHAQATSATLKFDNLDGVQTVTIEDNGRGFDINSFNGDTAGHYGIQSMRERTESIGGTFAIESVLDKGTMVSITLSPQTEGGN